MSATFQQTPSFNRVAEFFGSDQPETPRDPERDPAGKFRHGNRGGPGNPFARRVAKLRQAMMEECREEDLRAVTRTLLELAKGGDVAAAKLVYQYTLGKPGKMADPDRVDEDELNVLQGIALPPAVFEAMLNALPADTACGILQNLWPAMMKMAGKQMSQKVEADRVAEEEYQEDVATYEALPAEEKLAYYKAGGLTPPAELVEQAEKDRAARQQTGASASSEAASPVAAPSTNGNLSGDKFIDLSQRDGNSSPIPSTNGTSPTTSASRKINTAS